MNLGYHGLVAVLRGQVTEVTVDEVASRLDEIPALIDIREPDEILSGFIPGSVHIPRGVLESAVERLDRSTEVVLVCSGGNRTILAAASLQEMGFTAVASMAGGTTMWRMGGHPIVIPGATDSDSMPVVILDSDSSARYARQLVLPEIGPQGQVALGEASVLVVGAGGLGSPVALYLAAAGVGRLGIVDPDVVDITNLQRQIVHDTHSLGLNKADSASERLGRLNPSIDIESHVVRVTADNVLDMIAGYDVIVDATDSFPARYLLNDASLHSGIPLVHGSVFRFEGQVSVFEPYAGPCYRCLFPEPPPPELAPNCATAGVLGSVTGIVGSIQATEAIKLIVGIGTSLAGTLLTIDTLDNEWLRLDFRRDPECPACSPELPPVLVDYDDSCRPVAHP